MLLVSIHGWIIDDVVDEIKKDLGIYERVPVWERSEWPYITVAATVTSWNKGVTGFWRRTTIGTHHHFVSFDLP